MEGFPKVGHSSLDLANPNLKKDDLYNMKTSELKMELSFRGLKATGDRVILISRLAKVLDEDSTADTRKTKKLPKIDPKHLYVLRAKGHTTQNSGGLGIGLGLYDPDSDKELWSGRMYVQGDRTVFEAEYSAVIVGMEYAYHALGIRRIMVQSSCDVLVQQIRGVYKVNKETLRKLLAKAKELEALFDHILVEDIPSSQNAVCTELATQALATRKSFNVELGKNNNFTLNDPVKEFDRIPTKDGRWRQPDPPSFSAPIDPSTTYLLRFDGGSRGNPGIAGAGFVLYDDSGQEIWCGWKFHHEAATNNLAEYLGLLCGVKCARSFGVERLIVEGDSQLIVRHINGQYQCREESLKKFFNAVKDEAGHLEYFEIRHIPRDQNKRADWLANHAMDVSSNNSLCNVALLHSIVSRICAHHSRCRCSMIGLMQLQESGGFDEVQADI
jgi:ribonuclease HI